MYALMPGLVLVGRRGPRNMVHRARAGDGRIVSGVVLVERAALLAAGLEGRFAATLEPQSLLEEGAAPVGLRRVGANAVESLKRELGRNLRALRDERVVGVLRDDELEPEAFRVGEGQAALGPR